MAHASTSKRKTAAQGADCACRIGPGHKALAVDPALKESNRKRLRRIEGQIRGLQKMVEDDRYCTDIITQIAAAFPNVAPAPVIGGGPANAAGNGGAPVVQPINGQPK